MREQIYNLNSSSNLNLKIQGYLYQILWKLNDFLLE